MARNDDDDEVPSEIKDILDFIEKKTGSPAAVQRLDRPGKRPTAAEQVTSLRDSMALLNKPHVFKVGDVIRGKLGIANDYRSFQEPHIVLEVLERPKTVHIDESSVGTVNAARRYDMIVGGMLYRDGEVLMGRWLVDSRDWEYAEDWNHKH